MRKQRKKLIEDRQHCQMCGCSDHKDLTVHHQLGHTAERKRDPRRERSEYLTLLCERCHQIYNWGMAMFDRRHEYRIPATNQ